MYRSLQLCNKSVGSSIVEFAAVPLKLLLCPAFQPQLTISFTSVENLQNLLQSGVKEDVPTSRLEEGSGSGVLPRRADTFGGYDSSPTILSKSESSTIHALRKSTI